MRIRQNIEYEPTRIGPVAPLENAASLEIAILIAENSQLPARRSTELPPDVHVRIEISNLNAWRKPVFWPPDCKDPVVGAEMQSVCRIGISGCGVR
jgi:hypothetical protein